jgi:LysM repeat protein
MTKFCWLTLWVWLLVILLLAGCTTDAATRNTQVNSPLPRAVEPVRFPTPTPAQTFPPAPTAASSMAEPPTPLAPPTPTPVEAPVPTIDVIAASQVTYIVVAGDTLFAIAARFDSTVDTIRTTNRLDSDLILPGQALKIPVEESEVILSEAMVLPAPELIDRVDESAVDATPYRFAVLGGDLDAAYPAMLERERFTLHYDPATPPAIAPVDLAGLVTQILAHHEQRFGVVLAGRFDIYAAGSLFAAPDQALRGYSFSRDRHFQIVVDNGMESAMQRYIVAHELTHLYAWNTFGAPSSVMLSEGLAVYAGLSFAGEGALLSLREFCAAYAQAGALPQVSAELAYQGHLRNLENYYAAGCFVQFLIGRYGVEALARLYPTSDYHGIYDSSLADLEGEWMAESAASPVSASFSPYDFVAAVDETKATYLNLLADFAGGSEQVAAYRQIDMQWAAILAGQLPHSASKATE